jgi:hypothetical protein
VPSSGAKLEGVFGRSKSVKTLRKTPNAMIDFTEKTTEENLGV